MEWSSFLSDFTAGVLGTGLGLFVGLRIDHARERRTARRRDLQALQALVDRLAGRRAFSHGDGVGLLDDPEDMRRCNISIRSVRGSIATTASAIEVEVEALPDLRRMEADCAAYLDYVDHEPRRYAIALLRLRDRLYESELEIARRVPALTVRRPGAGNDGSIDWLTSE